MTLSHEQHNLLVDCLSFLDDCPEKLNDFETEFLTGKGPNKQYDSLQEKYEKYGEEVKLSDKQIGVLQRMYDKIINGEKPRFR